MTLRAFLNAGFALLVEAFTGLGVNVLEASDRAREAIGLDATSQQSSVEAQNQSSLAELENLMRGVA